MPRQLEAPPADEIIEATEAPATLGTFITGSKDDQSSPAAAKRPLSDNSIFKVPDGPKTNWRAFRHAGLMPVTFECNGYRQFHRMDASCHTKLALNATALARHAFELGHGGGFIITLRRGDKPWAGWEEFEKLGLAAADLTCEICDKKVPFHPSHINNHMQVHTSKNRRPVAGGVFCMTLQAGEVMPAEEDAFAEQG